MPVPIIGMLRMENGIDNDDEQSRFSMEPPMGVRQRMLLNQQFVLSPVLEQNLLAQISLLWNASETCNPAREFQS